MKMSEVNNFLRVCGEIEAKPINIKTAYKLAKLRSKLQEEADFFTSRLQAIVQKYGELDEDGNLVYTDSGNGIKIRDGALADCQAEVDELEAIEVELPNIKFNLDEFDAFNMSLAQVEALYDFIEE